MKIEYLGHSCFRLQTANGATVLTDPYTGVGYELPRGLKADILLVSHAHFDHAHIQAVSAQRVVNTAGEYELFGVKICGVESDHDPLGGTLRGKNIIYKIQADGLTVCHFGDLGEPCDPDILEKIGQVDVVLLPVGGNYTIDANEAKAYIDKIKPRAAIPMHYKPTDGTIDIDGAERFLRLFDRITYACPKHEVDLSSALSGSEKTEIIFMERERK
ncbi:MAG: MBL fold metallo-hydrolase [Clostridia bacterium]|nr:MBL fold metallo-hydrolase [Clostridia bacterium]